MQPNFKNRTLFHGDNLDFLRALNTESIDLIATDPPFNKGKDFHATPDSLASGAKFQDRWTWEKDVHQEWVDSMQDDHPKVWQAIEAARNTHSDSMGAFCCFLAVRLVEMHRILKPSGSIYLHCDDTASHYIKLLFDAIFGVQNFRNEITWERHTGGKNGAKNKMGRVTDRIFMYAKSDLHSYNVQYLPPNQEYIDKFYKFNDNDGRGPYGSDNTAAPVYSRNGDFVYKGFAPPSTGWRYTKETMEQLDRDGLLIFPSKSAGRIRRKRYLKDYKGKPVSDLWTDINMLQHNSTEKVGYPTQKPIALYSRIIQASCPEKGWVLDPFAGCATTCVAAEKLDRKWIGMDLWDEVAHVTHERLANECDADLFRGKVTFTSKTPRRTDDGDTASVYIKTPMRRAGQKEEALTKAIIKVKLMEELGLQCQACNREFDLPEYLELDHKWPKSEGGTNAIENRTLLCGPCNRRKSNKLTMTQLIAKNKKEGFMAR